jgi:DNA-binding transcriptional LysR family regulator
MLNTLYIRTFLAVVDMGNYTAAAEHLHMSQPAVSQHIRALEEHLGDVRLFRRVGQRMVPTHAGEELLAGARELMVLADRTEQRIRELRGQVSGQVTIGCTASSGEHLLPALLAAFHAQFPGVALAVHVAPGDALLQALASQQVSLLLLEEQQRRRGWESSLLGREQVSLLAAASHPLLAHEEVPPAMLREHPMILPGPGVPLRRTLEDWLRRRGVSVHEVSVALECDSIVAAVQAAREGMGLAFVPDMCLPCPDGVGRVALIGATPHQEWYVLRERGRGAPRAVQELYAFLTGTTTQPILARCGLLLPE